MNRLEQQGKHIIFKMPTYGPIFTQMFMFLGVHIAILAS